MLILSIMQPVSNVNVAGGVRRLYRCLYILSYRDWKGGVALLQDLPSDSKRKRRLPDPLIN